MIKPLHEVASSTDALKTARADPIQYEGQQPQSMDFIRSLILDIPIQTYREPPVSETMNIEKMLIAQMESEIRSLENPKDEADHVTFDIPLLIRLLEHAREGIKSDVELHNLVERIVSIREKGVLTMDDYAVIAGGDIEGTDKEYAPNAYVGQEQDESLASIKKLAGIR